MKIVNDVVYTSVTVESAKGGWIVRERGKAAEVISHWDRVVFRLKQILTSSGEGEK